MSWFPQLRLFARGVTSLGSIAASLKRLADHFDPPPDDGKAAPDVAALPDMDHSRAYAVETYLRKEKGRDPTPDEILRVMEGDVLEGGDEPEDLQRRRPPGWGAP